MALTKENKIGKIEVVSEYKHIQVRTDTVIKEDDKELSRSCHRHIVSSDVSDANLSKEHNEVQAIANSGIWTQAIKDAWVAKLAKDKEG
jgi:hypothetical protein|tara:strand:+ start:460 stop:726 length:267 start_codon:yes stop_codon:yes gene_type:complete